MKDLLKHLIRADSTLEKGEIQAAEVISEFFKDYDVFVDTDIWRPNRANLLVCVKGSVREKSLLFVSHLDVVPPGQVRWKYSPFEASEADGRIYGRGAADMKGAIVSVVTAIREIVDSKTDLKGDIVLVCCAGEETDSSGVKRFVEKFKPNNEPVTGIVITEPTDFDIVTAHRGMLWLEISTQGRTAHGSQPQLGINAISLMNCLLNELENYCFDAGAHPLLGSCSMSVNTIAAGKAVNVIPDRCSIGIDIRTLPGQDHERIISDFENIFSGLKNKDPDFNAEIRIKRSVGALETDTQSAFVKQFCTAVGTSQTRAVGFTTDGPHLAPLNVPIVIFGPGKSHLCHKPDEYIDLVDVEKGAEYYKRIIYQFLR